MPLLRLTLLLSLALAARPGRAQTPIYHCVGADGHPVFTDQPCASVQATPAPSTSTVPPPSLRPPAVTCAADVDDLREAAIDAFANGDANRLAGLMVWTGYGERTAVADIRALTELMRRPLLGIEVSGDDVSADSPAAVGAPQELIVRTAADDGSSENADETRFTIERHAGCLWLRQP